MQTPVLIVNDHPSTRRTLRRALEVAGYAVAEAADAESGLALLRESERSMVVLFNVVLFNIIMAGTDGIALLGAAASDAHLADRHAFVLVTPTPEQVEAVLGRLLEQLSVPVVAEPFDPDALRLTIARALRGDEQTSRNARVPAQRRAIGASPRWSGKAPTACGPEAWRSNGQRRDLEASRSRCGTL